MTCFFNGIENFSRQLKILSEWMQNSERVTQYKTPIISCYSLTSRQKRVAITVCALAIISLIVGVVSLGGTNIVGTQAAWAMVGAGAGISISVIGFMTANHLLFMKRVDQFLTTQDVNQWNRADDYSIYPEDTQGEFSFQVGEQTFYGKKYAQLLTEIDYFIEFHRTLPIHQERFKKQSKWLAEQYLVLA